MGSEILQQWIFPLIGAVGTGIAIYQYAVLNESKKRRHELQFLFAGIHQLTLAKRMEWDNQISLLPQPQNDKEMEVIRVHVRARDNLSEIGSAITALESVINTDSSAISAMLEKTIKQTELNNQLQTEASKNPTLPKNQRVTNEIT